MNPRTLTYADHVALYDEAQRAPMRLFRLVPRQPFAPQLREAVSMADVEKWARETWPGRGPWTISEVER